MKIFISHSSKDKEIGNHLVKLLRGIGLSEEEIIFTSNIAYGIPVGQNIFNWLKAQIREKPFVIYLLSNDYYKSIACLNEMGAAWIVENEHVVIFTKDFNINSNEFQSGAIDPREIGFFVNDEERILSFINTLESKFKISRNPVIINQQVKEYISFINSKKIDSINPQDNISRKSEAHPQQKNSFFDLMDEMKIAHEVKKRESEIKKQNQFEQDNIYQKFCDNLKDGKLADEEILLIFYAIETSKYKLKTGWQMEYEINDIRDWEKVNGIQNILSNKYDSVLRKFQHRGFIFVSAETGSGNAKEIQFRKEISDNFIDFPIEMMKSIKNTVSKFHLI